MGSKSRKTKLAIIDAHALIHRAYHALPPMTSKDGQPTGAVYGFTTMLLKMLSTLKPTHVVAAFDVKGPTFRHKQFKEYKATRKKADDELIVQFDTVRKVLKAFNIPVLDKKGYEADDIIGTLVEKIDEEVNKVVVTGDKDTLQLVDDDVAVFTLRRGITDTVLYNERLVNEHYGFEPEYLPDYKGLAGDPSDNIPGVPGVGDKTARELVGKYGSIEEIYQHLDELPGRARSRLEGHKKDALFCRKLATIKCDVAVEFSLDRAELADFDAEKVRRLFEELGFRSLLARIPASARGEVQPTLFKNRKAEDRNLENRDIQLPENYHLVESDEDKMVLKERLSEEKVIAFDTETDSLGARKWPIVGMSFAARDSRGKIEAWYVPVTPKTVREWKGLLEDTKIGKVGQNLKYDYEVVAQSGIKLGPIVFDTKIASYLLSPGSRQHSLDALAAQELGHHNIPISDLIGKKPSQILMSQVPLEKAVPYACEDADVAFRLYEVFRDKIKEAGLTRVFEELEMPLVPVLAEIELAGVKVDREALAKLRRKVVDRIERLRKKIWRAAGGEFNINSTVQLREVLYEKLKLPTDKIVRTQSGHSTAASELNKLRDEHEIVIWLEDYRELTKLLNTYIETLPKTVDEKTGRVYASFNQAVTATGRLSSSDPNLQNIPVRTESGKEIRGAFVAERGSRLIKADYSQLELRITAHLSQDEKMVDAFRSGKDIHRSTAAWVHGVELGDVTDKMRRAAKALNFGVLYGMGPHKFSQEAEVSLEEARSFIERYKEEYVGIARLIQETIRMAQEVGYVETMMGRRRYLPEINSRTPSIRAAAERAAFNFIVQGTAADILKKAMVELSACIQRDFQETRMILTVHDELVCEVPQREAEKLAKTMKKVMEGVCVLDVPVLVEVGIGTNWRDV